MYPFFRMIKEVMKAKRQPPLPIDAVHESQLMCWPWDLDVFGELNNGRTLTLFDLGRIPLGYRTGLISTLKREGWTMTMAGVSVQYRRRITSFKRLTLRSRCIGWDDKFIYIDQSFWRGETATTHAVYRVAVIALKAEAGKSRIIAPERVLGAMGQGDWAPELPEWVNAWRAAEADRPWPPLAPLA